MGPLSLTNNLIFLFTFSLSLQMISFLFFFYLSFEFRPASHRWKSPYQMRWENVRWRDNLILLELSSYIHLVTMSAKWWWWRRMIRMTAIVNENVFFFYFYYKKIWHCDSFIHSFIHWIAVSCCEHNDVYVKTMFNDVFVPSSFLSLKIGLFVARFFLFGSFAMKNFLLQLKKLLNNIIRSLLPKL